VHGRQRSRARGRRRWRAGGTAVQRRPTRDDNEEGRRRPGRGENAAARRTHRRVRWGRRRHGEDGGVVRSDTHGRERTAVVGGARGEAVGGGAVGAWHGDGAVGRRLSGRRPAVPTVPLRRGMGAWQPRGDGTLTGGPSMESGG
jgi:hypothetical protein